MFMEVSAKLCFLFNSVKFGNDENNLTGQKDFWDIQKSE